VDWRAFVIAGFHGLLDDVEGLSPDDRDFFRRAWATPPETYCKRVEAVGFCGRNDVLDAGCGFGQWTAALAALNRRVTALDQCPVRTAAVGEIALRLKLNNVEVLQGSIERTPFRDASFDGIFSYSVIYFTDYRQTLNEFGRLLTNGGILYICGNGLGWYLHNIIDGHNSTATFDSRRMGIDALRNSLELYAGRPREEGKQIVIPSVNLRAELVRSGFEIISWGAEGTCTAPGARQGSSFYEGEYHGAEGVYEIIARKCR
jgi:SAM-dependent methyltransferase